MKTRLLFLVIVLINLPWHSTFATAPRIIMLGSTDWIPTDFDPEHTILLIVKNSYIGKNGKDYYEKQNKELEAVMQKYYPYKYEFVEKPLRGKYLDTKTYPYMLGWDNLHVNKDNIGNQMSIYNLKTGKVSETNDWQNSFVKGILKDTIRQLVEVYQKRKKQK